MGKLTYSICYTPSQKISDDAAINYLCFDGKVHVRFRDFNSEMLVMGFERKLIYLLTYLMNYSYAPKVIGMYDENAIIDAFLKSADVTAIYQAIEAHSCAKSFKGIKLKKNYKRQGINSAFGTNEPSCFPLRALDSIVETGDLQTFLNMFRISLDEYLFNDSYIIILHEAKPLTANKKFLNKAINTTIADMRTINRMIFIPLAKKNRL